MTASTSAGRPKIDGLVSVNLRILQEQRDALDVLVAKLRAERRDPSLNRTDLIREAITEHLATHGPRKRSR
jgi:hypothetical protein